MKRARRSRRKFAARRANRTTSSSSPPRGGTQDFVTFNRVLILNSIPQGQTQGARRLFDDMRVLAAAYPPALSVDYQYVPTLDDLVAALESCVTRASQGSKTLVHIECHGAFEGFQLADGTFHSWRAITPALARLNTALELGLVLVVAACEGGAFASTANLSDRAPFWGLIGPAERISSGLLESTFRAFYTTLMETKDPQLAMAAMNAARGGNPLYLTNALDHFNAVWKGYQRKQNRGDALSERVGRLKAQLRANGRTASNKEIRQLLSRSEAAAFAAFRSAFFMYDLYPEHESRFRASLRH